MATDAERGKYAEIASKYFSAAVMENAMKWPSMEGADGKPAHTDRAEYSYQWCVDGGPETSRALRLMGCGEVAAGLAQELAQQPPDVIEARMKVRLRHLTSLFDGRITEWDLNNEMMHEDIFRKALGLKNGAAYFKWAKEIAPDTHFYVNEFGVLQGNEVDKYVKHIRELMAAGAAVGGIGD